jgi:hypothetical protein
MVSILGRIRGLPLLRNVQMKYEVHPAPCLTGNRGFIQEVKRPGLEGIHSPLSINVKRGDVAKSPLPLSVSWRAHRYMYMSLENISHKMH